ncbi:proteasome subunit alpha type 6 [Botrytis cinerea]
MIPSTSASGGAPRVPSWKRLGLKLKSAPDSSDSNSQASIAEPQREIEIANRKRPRDDTESEHETSAKKPKNLNSHPPASEPQRSIAPDSIFTTPRKSALKKSVTFTPETKSQDGDSIKQLYLGWVADQKAQDDFFYGPSTRTEGERVKKAKSEAKQENGTSEKDSTPQKSVKKSKVSKPIAAPRPFLAYLKQYHESKETWKFNKNHQNHLLKHAFNIEVVPSDHVHLLYEYVRGLQGGVRKRLRDEALAIKVKDRESDASGFPATMADSSKRQREYDLAMNEYVASMTAAGASSQMGYEEGVIMGLSDVAMAPRMAKRMRAEQILAELGSSSSEETTDTQATETESVATDGEKRLRLNDGTPRRSEGKESNGHLPLTIQALLTQIQVVTLMIAAPMTSQWWTVTTKTIHHPVHQAAHLVRVVMMRIRPVKTGRAAAKVRTVNEDGIQHQTSGIDNMLSLIAVVVEKGGLRAAVG